jgi:TetR/AcrR family transcriptional repressor of nem operon
MRQLATHQRILIEAQDLLQRFGFFGLSLQDLADRIKIRKPSLYAHYDSKESLGVSIIQDYDRLFQKWMDRLKDETPESKLQEFKKLLEGYLLAGKVCPNSALSLEGERLPQAMRTAYAAFLETQLSWLEKMIQEGQDRNYFLATLPARELARLAFQQTIGAELVTRMTGDMSWFHKGCEDVLKTIRGGAIASSSSLPRQAPSVASSAASSAAPVASAN